MHSRSLLFGKKFVLFQCRLCNILVTADNLSDFSLIHSSMEALLFFIGFDVYTL